MKAIAENYLAGVARMAGPARARTVVLLPYGQLLPVAAADWARSHMDGFAPRFETSQTWARSLRAFQPGGDDLQLDLALDLLTARRLLAQARPERLAGPTQDWAPMLVEAAYALAPVAAACPAAQRGAWSARLRGAMQGSLAGEAFAVESLIAQLALAWVGSSAYASDVLFEPLAQKQTDRVIALRGAQSDPLLLALAQHWGDRLEIHDLAADVSSATASAVAFHACLQAQDEAQMAAACVLRHLEQGRTPVALVAQDRALTRRIRAMLAGAGVTLRDETGWKLSTSRLGAQLMLALRACRNRVGSDEVLAWLKQSEGWDAAGVQALEDRLRVIGQGRWEALTPADLEDERLVQLWASIQARRQAWRSSRPLVEWLDLLRQGLAQDGVWDRWQNDAAGITLARALRLDLPQRLQEIASTRPWRPAEFLSWVDQVLEGVSFRPEAPESADVVILPLAQMPGRRFDAVVIPGCDEVRLPLSPEPDGGWTPAQRALLGLPTREEQSKAVQRTWQAVVALPAVDILWRRHDDAGETLLASPLVRLLQLQLNQPDFAADPRARRDVAVQPIHRPQPQAAGLVPERLSASAYQDLRHCPYRFFALRQLGLREAEELDAAIDKRDFGLWLHSVLQQFHESLRDGPNPDRTVRQRLLDACAESARQKHQLTEEEFLPFTAAWPAVRDGYLDWLAEHEATGACFDQSEAWHEQPLGRVRLIGQIDRIDRLGDEGRWVIDYKTESQDTTRQRIREPMEDTQLAFYAALLSQDRLRAAYLHLGERGVVKLMEQPEVTAARDALVEGIIHDIQRIADGAPVPALGEGVACERCAARGLCRRDFWESAR